ncbi:hypothetical protein [Solicola sp. PLA-1-18]|uniref:hypothetical protein n=1 Tax=Solicola sp. PLA-1-18 TaxID=3380532 RepID=UPI003B7F5C43
MNTSFLDDRRVVIGGTAAIALLLLVATWFLAAGPQLAAADQHAIDRADAQVQNTTLQAKITKLAQDNEQINVLQADLAAAQDGLPSTTALPGFTRQLTQAAESAGVELDDVTISPPTGAVQGAEQPADGSAAAATGQQAITVSLTSSGSLVEQTAFVKSLQDGARRVLVGSTQLSVDGGSKVASVDVDTVMTTQVTIFSAPAA